MIKDAKDVNDIAERPMVLAGPGDSIRIVPLYVPEEITQLKVGAVAPKLTYRGGCNKRSARTRPFRSLPPIRFTSSIFRRA